VGVRGGTAPPNVKSPVRWKSQVKYVIDKAADAGLWYAVLSLSGRDRSQQRPHLDIYCNCSPSLFRQQIWLLRNALCIIRVCLNAPKTESWCLAGFTSFTRSASISVYTKPLLRHRKVWVSSGRSDSRYGWRQQAKSTQGDQKVSVQLMFTVQKSRKNILNTFNHLP
jgi:hypothetical protein